MDISLCQTLRSHTPCHIQLLHKEVAPTRPQDLVGSLVLLRVAPGSHKKATGHHADDIVCLVDVEPQNKWSFVGSDIRHMMNTTQDPLFLTPDMLEEISSSAAGESEFISSRTDIQRNGITIIFSASGNLSQTGVSYLEILAWALFRKHWKI